MKSVLFLLAMTSFTASAHDVYVNTYQRKDGTTVQGYHRTSPNNSTSDNYDTKGNTNPYTGKEGTVDPKPSK